MLQYFSYFYPYFYPLLKLNNAEAIRNDIKTKSLYFDGSFNGIFNDIYVPEYPLSVNFLQEQSPRLILCRKYFLGIDFPRMLCKIIFNEKLIKFTSDYSDKTYSLHG